jgi:surface polysaccharide O-acyltransferase-like enzyme
MVALDGVRVLALLGVVTIHTVGRFADPEVGGLPLFAVGSADWAVAAFFMISGFVTGTRGHARSSVERWTLRLAIPYAIWSVIYLLLRGLLGLDVPSSVGGIAAVLILGQASVHLWFLPALIACHVAGLLATSARRAMLLAAFAAPLLFARLLIPEGWTLLYPLLRYSALGWLSVYFLGIGLSQSRTVPIDRRIVRSAALLLPVVMGAVFVGSGESPLAKTLMTMVGIVLCIVVISDIGAGGDGLALGILGRLGPLVFPAYLFHMVPVYLLQALIVGDSALSAIALSGAVIGVVATSLVVAVSIRRIPGLRFAVGELRCGNGEQGRAAGT